jgi:hypothetical protein
MDEKRASQETATLSSDMMQEAFASVRNVTQAHLDYLLGLGVSPGALACLGQVQPPLGSLVFGRSRGRCLSQPLRAHGFDRACCKTDPPKNPWLVH